MEPNRNAINTERLDRLVQVDLTLLDVESLRFQLLRDVRRRNGTEELSFIADARGEGQRDLLEARRQALRRLTALILSRFETITLLLDALQVPGRRFVGEIARKQIVASVAVLDLHDVPGLAEVLDGLTKNDFHKELPTRGRTLGS